MRIPRPFVKLPLSFDHLLLADEISQFDETDWRLHPQGFAGNSSLILVSKNGEENDDVTGSMQPASRLKKAPYIQQVMESFSTVIGRSRLMRLSPGASVNQHTDSHYFWRNHIRIHIPIVTAPEVIFRCDQEQVFMKPGESWTFNNWRPHSVVNGSEHERIHLEIDVVGSSNFWRMIDGRNSEEKRIEYSANKPSNLRFESYPGLPVMPPQEMKVDLEGLVGNIVESNSEHSLLKSQIAKQVDDFIHDWHALWVVHGPYIEGFADYKALLETFRRDVTALPDGIQLSSNKEKFSEAATFTLDAALVPGLFVASRASKSTSSHRPKFDRPVFIVAAPRSGSTLLFETLAVNRELWSIGDESHKHFERIASLRPSGKNPSNRLSADLANADVKDTLLDSFVEDLRNCDGKLFKDMTALSKPSEIRFLEKTPKNALRIPFLLEVFPDARFIFLFRDPKQNMSSLLESWKSQKFVTYPTLPGWSAPQKWSHLLTPGWQELAGAPLAEVVAHQWLTTNQTIMNDLKDLPKERWCAIDYDSLLANTPQELQRLCHFSQVIFGPRLHKMASEPLRPSKYTHTAPNPGKWKMNEQELASVIPKTEELMAQLKLLIE